jgi:hypothetical protein
VTGVTVRLGRIAVIGSRVDPYLHPWVESRVSRLRRGAFVHVSASAAVARAAGGVHKQSRECRELVR